MRTWFRNLGVLMLAVLLPGGAARAEDDAESLEYPIVAAYVYNLTQFTVWPASVPAGSFTLCVLGNNPFGELLTPLKQKTARGSPFTLRYMTSLTLAAGTCQVMFVAPSESGRLKAILAQLQNAPILTISNIEHFAESGGMVELSKDDTRIIMNVNNIAVQRAGLSISSKLLSLAHIVGAP
jgi:hypothetical protein